MFSSQIHLSHLCENCGKDSYLEDESGFYVCDNCGTMTDIRCGVELDYETFGKGLSRFKSKKKTNNNSSDEDDLAENDITIFSYKDSDNETNFLTNKNISSYNDGTSTFSRKSSRNKNKKINILPEENVIEKQLYFENIFNEILKEYLNKINNLNDINKLIEYTKKIWFNFIFKEFIIQKNNINTFSKKKTKFARSRQNTIDNPNQITNETLNYKKNKHLFNQLNSKKIVYKNITKVYKDNNNNKLNIKKFLEEYDSVYNYLRNCDEINQEINFNKKYIVYEELIKVCDLLLINYEDCETFEDLIHNFFLKQDLNYKTTHNINYNYKKSLINGNNFLFIIYKCFNENNYLNFPLLFKDLLIKFKNFNYLKTLNYKENLKYLKYDNYNKFMNLINDYNKHSKYLEFRIKKILKYIIIEILNLNINIFYIALFLCKILKNEIIKLIEKNNNIEYFCYGLIYYILKLFYEFNELPYLFMILKNNFNLNEFNNLSYKNKNNIQKNKLYEIYYSLPSIFDLLNKLNNLIENEENNQIIFSRKKLKINFNIEYKNKYADAYLNGIYNNIIIDFSLKNINELQNKFEEKYCNNNKNNINLNINNKKIKSNIEFNKKFLEKKSQKNSPKINEFLNEELKFINDLNKDNDINNNEQIEIPFPCETYVKYKRHAFKFENIERKTTELLFMYYFCKYFKIDYICLKEILNYIEKSLNKKEIENQE